MVFNLYFGSKAVLGKIPKKGLLGKRVMFCGLAVNYYITFYVVQ